MAEEESAYDLHYRRRGGAAALAGWEAAVRAKADWQRKILDDDRGLCAKWVAEGDLGRWEVDPADIDSLARELKAEAARTLAFDQLSFVASGGRTDTAPAGTPLSTEQVDRIEADVREALGRAAELIETPTLRDNLGVRTADGFVPESLHSLLVSELEAFQRQPPIKDFHPGSDGKVLDVIHPSLYPFVAGRSRLVSGTGPDNDLFETRTYLQLHDEYAELDGEVAHKRLTSCFDEQSFRLAALGLRISETGRASIVGYVNGLGVRSDHPALYAALENVFTLALPLIEQSLNAPFERVFTESYQRWQERRAFLNQPERYDGMKPQAWLDFQAEQQRRKAEGFYSRKLDDKQPAWEAQLRGPIDLKGRDLKVIVKVAEYHLKPGQTYEGSWHIEGAPHEMIGSSLIYYYETSPDIRDNGLNLRRVRIEGDKPDTAEEHGAEDYSVYFEPDDDNDDDAPDEDSSSSRNVPSDWGSDFDPYSFSGSVPLGTISTTGGPDRTATGRALAFPNWVQHQVAGLENTARAKGSASDEVAKRKILCFFVVREDRDGGNKDQLTLPGLTYSGLQAIPPVITTRQVPPQQHHLTFPPTAYWLAKACENSTGTALPIELCHRIFLESGTGLSRAEAEHVRREVMNDRGKLTKDEGEFWEMADYGLCEH